MVSRVVIFLWIYFLSLYFIIINSMIIASSIQWWWVIIEYLMVVYTVIVLMNIDMWSNDRWENDDLSMQLFAWKWKAQMLPTRCEIPFDNRRRKKAVWSLCFAPDIESEEFNDKTIMIGGFPWKMRHNYSSMMPLHTIIFLMMTHHWINDVGCRRRI